ncbi:hypothetical protein SZN_35857 [Streptomyces zinciresistens K42]|uniref:Uncharacterized protein n=1 Tax=Streptomyces zinciresistens K42 TaxID=700597 RepID=G2GNR6_9ACTN|nr:hypothetical protein [Streptomyces zinciresistens]EGX54852.1 hypothetical protein SZN_35857 [Streptomyces zinciresistens K42]
MTRPSARSVLPEFTERTSSGARTPDDPYPRPPEERVVVRATRIDAVAATAVAARSMHPEHEEMPARHPGRTRAQMSGGIGRDEVLDAREAVAHGPADRVVPGRADTLAAPAGR